MSDRELSAYLGHIVMAIAALPEYVDEKSV